MDTLANGLAVAHFAQSVGSASPVARVDALATLANGVHWTVSVAGAVALRLASLAVLSVRIANVVGRTLAHRIVGRPGRAQRRRMAGIRLADFGGCALDICQRIGPEARRALTDGSVIVRDAHRVETASVLVAGVVALVLLKIAQLTRWTVGVVHARHALASPGGVVRVARERPARALAVSHVIAHDAQSVRSAGQKVAHRLATERAGLCLVGLAGLLLGAVGVADAAVATRALTAETVVRIAAESRQAFAERPVATCHALRVGRASEAFA